MIIGIIILPNKIVKAEEIGNPAFDDVNFYKCVVDAYNKKNNPDKTIQDNLTDEELQTITELSCSGSNKQDSEKIISAKGLEKLTELTTFIISFNNLSSIDVSQNTKLTSLNLQHNNINEIDVRQNTELTRLDLSYNNLNSIDVTKNTLLTDLHLIRNNISEIDVNANTELIALSLDNGYFDNYNSIKQINLQNNTKLTTFNFFLTYLS